MLRREAAAGAYLHLEARWYFETKTRGNKLTLSRQKGDIGIDGRGDVAAAGTRGHARGNRKTARMIEALDMN